MIGRERSGGTLRVVGSRRSSGPNKLLTGYIVLSCWRNERALSGKVQNTIHHVWMDEVTLSQLSTPARKRNAQQEPNDF